ncbi:MAG: hypothetical protein IT303_17270 [Dehalococcoidia bacterium]|nr:hypothetical protein [Dehalococcoidia bacterium]
MAEQASPAKAPEPQGEAGYISPYPYVERLQEKMDERLAKKVPVKGRFCGFCYGRIRAEAETCPYCAHAIASAGTVDEVPQEVLRAYLVKQKTEARWVHLGAFSGLIVAMFLFLYLVVWGPGLLGHPAVGFAVLIGGGYVLAQLFGPLLAGQVGYRKGARKRDELWAAYLAKRDRAIDD